MLNKIKIAFLLFSFLLLNFSILKAQNKFTITCFVTDFQTGKFLGGSNIFIKELSKGGTSDEKGFFSMDVPPGKYHLRVSYVGYENFEKEIIVDKNILLDISLKSKEFYLNEIEILSGKKTVFKKNSLYDFSEFEDEPNVYGFYSVNLFNDNMTNEVWWDDKKCVQIKLDETNTFRGKGALHIKWNKLGGGCKWVGMGFGWDGWTGKDIGGIVDKAAIQMYVRTKKDTLKNLPLALALEDYSGVQSWTGFSPAFILGGKITPGWTKILIPFNSFPMKREQLDDSNIKQFMIQFEVDGDLFMDEVTIVPFEGVNKKTAMISYAINPISIDGNMNEMEWGNPSVDLDENKIYLKYDSVNFYLAAKIKDENPLMNKNDNAEIWNGDAIEIALGANPNADMNRTFFMTGDFQLGIKATEQPYIFSWKNKMKISDAVVKTKKTPDGYFVESKIPLSSLGNLKFEKEKNYGLEIAIDNGNENGRTNQLRWASPQQEGFNLNPFLWGVMKIMNE